MSEISGVLLFDGSGSSPRSQADARIYNPRDFDPSLASPLDTVLQGYAQHETLLPQKLDGDFAFAIWDEQKRRLFLARDPFAVKPLFYTEHHGLFAFASDIRTLLETSGIPAEPDRERLEAYLGQKPFDPSRTFYKHVRRLLPAHQMTVYADGKTKITRFWSVDPEKETRLSSEEAYAERFLELFSEAVRKRIPSSGDIGTTLSGGLDSSSVFAITQSILSKQRDPRKLHAFSLMFPETDKTAYEKPYIDAALSRYPAIHHPLPVENLSPLGEWQNMIDVEDGPIFQPTFYLISRIFESCRQNGVSTLLDGMDGDMIAWHGNNYWADLFRSGRWIELAKQISGCSGGTRWADFRHWKKVYGAVVGRAAAGPTGYQTDSQRHARAINDFLYIESLETLNRLETRYGVELRHPFLDKALAEFCVSIPGSMKNRYSMGRWTMRQAMKDILPEEIRMRRGKAMPFDALTRGTFSKDLAVVERALTKNGRLAEFAPPEETKKLFEDWKKNPSDTGIWNRIWALSTASLWLESL